ncbi:hypothetical protein Rleg_6103 (plasmid) [Rhizobium leguminosarum bv. trifolii WSM1325]|jgi:hypothetical protein|uniref:Uncharacterized protein n=1 Tax=Rhizobium leguminosarum bv. trifolii (strain WSM1325) TaxID=395491 RepID=C6BAB7_RHILS|nr:hypothetical protein Rleg_6103 [Rhizobium leguminosarum bv. trifolii WSM1325]
MAAKLIRRLIDLLRDGLTARSEGIGSTCVSPGGSENVRQARR